MTLDALQGRQPSREQALRLLTDQGIELLPLLHGAFQVRKQYFGLGVRVHILNNVQNGYCPEDCNYCAQAKNSSAPIEKYTLKSDEEILQGAEKSYNSGAYRYCIVLSGRQPPSARVEHMSKLIRQIKQSWPVEVCLSAGFLDRDTARQLKEAGLDRYNHNLNTAESHYGSICTTHSYAERVKTLEAARLEGLDICSGIIIGMGETADDIVTVAMKLRQLNARSIPVNFYVHVPGAKMGARKDLTPQKCLRTLALFRFINPDAEIRAAGGREVNLGAMEALALYPANSLFSEGYLNVGGHGMEKTKKMIEDAGFFIERVEEAD
ncbi:MAG: biotin synthase BioB [Magnetococcales bacterium]|nr:biotin synthase BioB [Magnetococcales bacterium]